MNSPVSAATPERNSRGCLTKCPECGASLDSASTPQSTSAIAAESPAMNSLTPAVPEKKGLFGIGFLGLGGRRRNARRGTKRRGRKGGKSRRAHRRH